jgi:hypothetical protein
MPELTLGITKIGDLLTENKITQDKNGDPITNINLKIPNYQRPYKWTEKNVIQLIDDILGAKNESKEVYRIGTLILHREEEKNYSREEIGYNIVDGQQRIITLSLLLKAFEKSIGEELSIPLLDQKLSDNSFNRHNIPGNFRVCEKHAQSIADDNVRGEVLCYIKKNCEFIVVITDDVSEAFQFFDSQNARGKKLYPHDLLKAYHLREMNDMEPQDIERTVKIWEDLDQKKLSSLFSDYLFRVKEWTKGNSAWKLTEQNIDIFKGITKDNNFPYAQLCKGAYIYADTVNNSTLPFVTGIRNIKLFQLNSTIIAGKPFFDYAKHYYEILMDIQDNSKYEGYYINDNPIVKTLDLEYKNGVGNRIVRLLFDTAILSYVDRFCPEKPCALDLKMLEQFVVFALVWAYSLRAQYHNVGWRTAQNYIMGNKGVFNSFNIYKTIAEADSPASLFGALYGKISPLPVGTIKPIESIAADSEKIRKKIKEEDNGVHQYYLHYFEKNNFIAWNTGENK